LPVREVDAESTIEYSRKAAILAQFQASGIIHTLPEEFNRRQLSVDDYLHVFASVQLEFLYKHRHFLFVSGMCHIVVIIIITAICNVRVLTTLENLEMSGNLLILQNSGNLKFTQGIYQMLAVFCDTILNTQEDDVSLHGYSSTYVNCW